MNIVISPIGAPFSDTDNATVTLSLATERKIKIISKS